MTTEAEFIKIIKKNESLIYKACYLYARGDRELVRDLYQEAVCALWKSRWRFNNRSSEQTWIYRVTLNTVVSYHRHQKRNLIAPLADNVADTLSLTDDEELVERLYDLIGRLSAKDPKMVYLYLDGLSLPEIAKIIGLNYSNVGVRIHRIKEMLKTLNQNIN